MSNATSTAERHSGCESQRSHPAMVIAVVIALHFVVYALVLQLTETLIAYKLPVSREPSPLIGMLQGWCSLTAIWWMRSSWSSPVKTLHAALAFISIWAILVMSGERTSFSSVRGAAWLASLMTQFVGTAVGVWLLSIIKLGRSSLPAARFTIMFLILWTLVIGVILGASRRIVESFGWTWDILLRWEYFPHLLVVGAIGALQAYGMWATVQSVWSWRVRSIACGAIAVATMAGAILILYVGFSDSGADALEIGRQFGLQALFLVVTLIPLQLAAEAASSAELQTPLRPDSGR